MEIKILGAGCAKCKALAARVAEAVKEMNIDADIKKADDINEIVSYGIMITPALVINNKVVMSGKNITKEEIKNLIQNNS